MVGGEQHGDIESWKEVLGMTTGRRHPGDKETWWWNDEVKDAIRAKKEAKKKWDASGRQEERDIYRQANKEAKKEVAISKAHAMDEVTRSWKHLRENERSIEWQRRETNLPKISRRSDRLRMNKEWFYGNMIKS